MTDIQVRWLVPPGPAPAAVLGTPGATWPQQLYAAGLIPAPTIGAATEYLLDGWVHVTADTVAAAGQLLSVDTTAGPVTITLPAAGGLVAIRDHAGTWDTNPVYVEGNGLPIEGCAFFVLDEFGWRIDFMSVAGEWRYSKTYVHGSYLMNSLSGGAAAAPATSTPISTTINDTTAHMIGPFVPQLAREIWLTLNATVAATGTAQLLRSTDNGVTRLPITRGGAVTGEYAFGGLTGLVVNEPVVVETSAAATYYLTVTLSAGTLTVLIEQ